MDRADVLYWTLEWVLDMRIGVTSCLDYDLTDIIVGSTAFDISLALLDAFFRSRAKAGDVAFLNWEMLGYSGVSASGRATMMVGETRLL